MALKRNRPRRRKRLELNYGTHARREWWSAQPCECGGLHPACYGRSVMSHTRSKAHAGDSSTIIAQSWGCHEYIGAHGWSAWERDTGIDRHELAALRATQGPDAPGARE